MDRYKLVSKGSAEINSPNNAPFICELVHKTAFWHKKKSLQSFDLQAFNVLLY
jgi:hypothetical protein